MAAVTAEMRVLQPKWRRGLNANARWRWARYDADAVPTAHIARWGKAYRKSHAGASDGPVAVGDKPRYEPIVIPLTTSRLAAELDARCACQAAMARGAVSRGVRRSDGYGIAVKQTDRRTELCRDDPEEQQDRDGSCPQPHHRIITRLTGSGAVDLRYVTDPADNLEWQRLGAAGSRRQVGGSSHRWTVGSRLSGYEKHLTRHVDESIWPRIRASRGADCGPEFGLTLP